MAEPVCPVCGSPSPKRFLERWEAYELFLCPECDVSFCAPFKGPGPEWYARNRELYPDERPDYAERNWDYRQFLGSRAGRGRRLLDVGCGSGEFLAKAASAGYEPTGIDFNERYVELARKRGLERVYATTLEDFAAKTGPAAFDVITLFQVLEHLEDPRGWVRRIHGLLAPGGRLVIGVPNRERSLDTLSEPEEKHKDRPPHHLTRWSRKALGGFLEREGFEISDLHDSRLTPEGLALVLRNKLRLGLATRAAGGPIAPASAGSAGRPAPSALSAAVRLKEVALGMLAWAIYPLLIPLPLEGHNLFCVAKKRG